LTDLTDLKKREAELISATSFLANMGGDIRGPMKTLADMSSALRETPLDHHQTDILTKMERSEDKLFRIIDDIMDFSKLDAGLMRP